MTIYSSLGRRFDGVNPNSAAWYLAAAVIVLCGKLWEGTAPSLGPDTDSQLHSLRIDTFQFIAWGIGLYLLSRLRVKVLSAWLLGALLGLTGIATWFDSGAGLAMLTTSIYFADRGDRKARACAAVFAALFAQQVISPILFRLFVPYLVWMDSSLVGPLVEWTVPGAIWGGATIEVPSGHAIEIEPGCCSFRNASLAMLAWVALTKLERPEWRRFDLLVMIAAVGFQVVINTARIYLMSLSLPYYQYWHQGTGAQIFAVAASVGAIVIATLGSRQVTEMSLR